MPNSPIVLDPAETGPLYQRLIAEILRRIRVGTLRPGDRLPPTRTLARDLGINRSTVSTAYEELVSEGVLESHVGRGTFVTTDLTIAALAPVSDGEVQYRWQDHFAGITPPPRNPLPSRSAAGTAAPDLISFARNVPDQALFPAKSFGEALTGALAADGPGLLGYAPAEGHPEFIPFLLDYLESHRQMRVGPEQVLVVNGSQQAIDLICRAFLRPGDTVAVEEPTYSGALELFRSFGARVVGIPMDDEGLRLEETEAVLARERPKLLYTMPTFQNPTGCCMGAARRESLVRLVHRYEVPLIEDDFDGELYYDEPPPPPLRSLVPSQGVMYIGTPSKMLFPGLRIGWIVAERPVVERLSRIKQIADLSSSQLLQAAFVVFARSGALNDHKNLVRAEYGQRRDTLLRALGRHLPGSASWTRPGGGMSLLVSLPEGLDSEALLEECAREGVLYSPGRWFFVNGGSGHLRLCFGDVAAGEIERGVERLGRVVRRAAKRGREVSRRSRDAVLPQV